MTVAVLVERLPVDDFEKFDRDLVVVEFQDSCVVLVVVQVPDGNYSPDPFPFFDQCVEYSQRAADGIASHADI
jgi:hypothetical protein